MAVEKRERGREIRYVCLKVDPVQLSSRKSCELEFEFQDTADSKIGCIRYIETAGNKSTVSRRIWPVVQSAVYISRFQDTGNFTTDCILKLELELETLPRTEPNKLLVSKLLPLFRRVCSFDN